MDALFGNMLTFLAMVIAGSRALIAESLQVVACFGFLAYFRPHEFGRITATIFAFYDFAHPLQPIGSFQGRLGLPEFAF